jgi:hypothetical protein
MEEYVSNGIKDENTDFRVIRDDLRMPHKNYVLYNANFADHFNNQKKCKKYSRIPKTKFKKNKDKNFKWQSTKGIWEKCRKDRFSTLSMMKEGTIDCLPCPDKKCEEYSQEVKDAIKENCSKLSNKQEENCVTTTEPTTRAPISYYPKVMAFNYNGS